MNSNPLIYAESRTKPCGWLKTSAMVVYLIVGKVISKVISKVIGKGISKVIGKGTGKIIGKGTGKITIAEV